MSLAHQSGKISEIASWVIRGALERLSFFKANICMDVSFVQVEANDVSIDQFADRAT